MKKKVMILTASIGCGHDQAAETLATKLEELDDEIEIIVMDFMEILNSSISHLIKSSYLKMIALMPNWYHHLYNYTMKIKTNSKVKNIFIYRYEKKLMNLIWRNQPDMIIFTNPFPLMLVSDMKRKGKIKVKTAAIITDYTAHRIWLDDAVNHYFVGCDALKEDLKNQGIDKKRISVTGIPIRNHFYTAIDKERVLREQGLQSERPTILIMGGGLGLGPIEEMITMLEGVPAPLQLLVVAGKNRELIEALQAKAGHTHHEIKLYGYYQNIHELMGIADLLISKAGGITMTEAIQKELPVLITNPIPGQEVGNAEILSRQGTAKYIQHLEELTAAVEDLLLKDAVDYQQMKEKCKKMKKADASMTIATAILKTISHEYKEPMIR